MRYQLAALALAAAASALSPSTAADSSCSSSYSGTFEIQVVNTTTTKRDLTKRAALVLTLADGILKDAEGRIGYIASNRQFQFDNPVQDGTIYDAGWAVCSNGTLVLGPDAVFQQCLSGTFYNLYDEATAAQCNAVYIDVVNGSGAVASQVSDGQVTASAVASQLTDGQVQATPVPVTQISDGQIQATTGVAPVTQITDGQIQAPTTTAKPTTSTYAVVSQISDGQAQAPTNGSTPVYPSATVQPYTGAAAFPTVRSELFGLAAGVLAVAML